MGPTRVLHPGEAHRLDLVPGRRLATEGTVVLSVLLSETATAIATACVRKVVVEGLRLGHLEYVAKSVLRSTSECDVVNV